MHVCMIVPNEAVKGGIASVVNGYRGSDLERHHRVTYIESYQNGSKWDKLKKAMKGYAAFRRLLGKDRPDLVHVHSSFGPSFYRKMPFILWSASRKIPVVNHIHGAEFDAFYENASRRKESWCGRFTADVHGWWSCRRSGRRVCSRLCPGRKSIFWKITAAFPESRLTREEIKNKCYS